MKNNKTNGVKPPFIPTLKNNKKPPFIPTLKKPVKPTINNKIMCKDNPLWYHFLDKLELLLSYTGHCSGSLKLTTYLLNTYYQDLNTEKSLDYIRSNGGHCDCEVFINVV